MSHTVTPSMSPNAGQKPRLPSPKTILLWCIAALIAAAIAFCLWAVVFPSQVPARVGDLLYPGERLIIPAGGSADVALLGTGVREGLGPGSAARTHYSSPAAARRSS